MYERGNEMLDYNPLLDLTSLTSKVDNYPIMETNSRRLKEYSNWFLLYKGHILSYHNGLFRDKQEAIKVLNLIKKEYHLEEE